ncbi:MAG: class I tRNA ligase family protein [Candidatus Peribacteraceae bacterium]|nr:class I tRNA ligase family protein [Candidatus Peribacteraceae bacterium]
MPAFDPVDPRQSFPELERGLLEYWRQENVFERSLEERASGERYGFYDGPPFATGLPHYGHLLAGTIKDVMPRYQTMRGKRVERRFGWDCHGLPIENIIEKEHGIAGKPDIEKMGVAAFNQLCRNAVQRYAAEWRVTVERAGRWVDMDNDYRTMDPSYMESIWWVMGRLAEKKLLYEGYKPMHVCPRCVTPLSNFEVSDGYKDVTDLSATAMFELVDEPGTYVLAWTTTPWTLPGNLLLAVGADIDYVRVTSGGKTYVVAEERVATIFKDIEHEIDGKAFKGKKLVGQSYKPLFPYYAETYPDAFRVVAAEFVSVADGTGIVHIAPGFGEDDFRLGKEEKLEPLLQHVSMDGHFKKEVTDFAGLSVKPSDDPSKTDRLVAKHLKEKGLLFKEESYRHSYPHCWRCDSPLLNYATGSWFVAVEKIKETMLQANATTEWMPAHLRDGRFGKWLENARDWAISRNRYWGTPLPIWRSSADGPLEVISNRAELMDRQKIRFTRVTTLRHGQSEGNLAGLFQGKEPGTALTAAGREMAAKGADFVKDRGITRIYCSPLQRCQETAAILAEATGAEIVIDERLREIDMGPHEGKTWKESTEQAEAQRHAELKGEAPQPKHHLPGMEPLAETQARISAFLAEVLPRHRGTHIAIVSHADPLLCVRHHFTLEAHRKLVAQPKPAFAAPEEFFWDHNTERQMDLHKDVVDHLVWPGPSDGQGGTLTVARHGETDHNQMGIIQGHVDRPLNEKGRQQAADTAKTLKKDHYDVLISSDLIRAVDTANALGGHLGLEITEKNPMFRERMMGDWQGRGKKEFDGRHPGNPCLTSLTPEGGESLSEFLGRAQAAYRYIQKTYPGKRVLLVAHGGFMAAMRAFMQNQTYAEMSSGRIENLACHTYDLSPLCERTPEVLDCWFESGSMPYAQYGFPQRFGSTVEKDGETLPVNFPADFIAEGIDQTRGWFYTLTVLGAALFGRSPFRHCIVNGTVLAEDGLKMSKKLKNYPDPLEVVEKHGADALRFTLMGSPAVRAEDMRFSERAVEENVRSVVLPLWNSYSFFVTYANEAGFEPSADRRPSAHPLDRWITAQTQDLANRMTEQLEAYDLSAGCAELKDSIDALTNWYIRLSRRRFAGKGDMEQPMGDSTRERDDALQTLHGVLVTISQLLAPFCPFVTESMYLNLTRAPHASVHLTLWPEPRALSKEEHDLIARTRLLRTAVSLGLKLRSEAKVRVRQPLQSVTLAVPPSQLGLLNAEEIILLRQELNVKDVILSDDPGSLGRAVAQVNARKVGPRLGGRVQEVIAAGKRGEFTIEADGTVLVLEERLSPDEVTIAYQAGEGQTVAADQGIVVSLNTQVSAELEQEGLVRDLIRAIQQLRKEGGLAVSDRIELHVEGIELTDTFKALIQAETNASFGQKINPATSVEIDGKAVQISFQKL